MGESFTVHPNFMMFECMNPPEETMERRNTKMDVFNMIYLFDFSSNLG